jgi:geranylgeranyl diphosphate synthase, type I
MIANDSYLLSLRPLLTPVEDGMQAQIASLTGQGGLATMLRYALGWVDRTGEPQRIEAGKRLRPALLLTVAGAAGGSAERAIPAAVAVELLHNFSLIHDDVQDRSLMRHNRPTVWQVWGVPHAINAGDAMFTLAFRSLLGLRATGLSPERLIEAYDALTVASLELTHGQYNDMRFEDLETVSKAEYLSMIEGKSASLLAASCSLGALIAEVPERQIARYHAFGLALGLAFQIHDDILGIWGEEAVTGKSAASDLLTHKKSLPILTCWAQSERFREVFRQPDLIDHDVHELLGIMDALSIRDEMQRMESAYLTQALQALKDAKPSVEGLEQLEKMVDYLFHRAR